MRLAEQNTLELQRTSLERKRLIGDYSTVDGTSEREACEKRRKLELEKRIQQREEDEKQRQAQARASADRRRKERLLAEEVDRKQSQQRQAARSSTAKVTGTSSKASNSSGRAASSARDSAAPRRALPKEEQVLPKRPEAPRLSYEEVMRIASGEAEPPAKRPVRPVTSSQPQDRQPQQRTLASAVRTGQGRQRSPNVDASAPRRQQPVGSSGIRQAPKQFPAKSRDSPALSPVKKASAVSSRLSEPRERQKSVQAPRRAPGVESAPKQKVLPEPRVRKAPERELDRFGVCAAGSARKNPVGRTATQNELSQQRARIEAMPRPNSRRDEQIERRPRPRSPVSSRNQRAIPGNRSAPDLAKSSSRQRDRSPRRRLSPPPPVRGRSETHQSSHKRHDTYDNESEYDSLDDFIVDDEEEGGSKYSAGTIRKIMGVKYRHVNDDDDDDDDMEVSTHQLMMEERRSARLGRQEDEEEERRLDEEERARARRRREKRD
ncbi:hypothetical protein IWW38_000804 [Coemansia aciculifera]|uniref:Uncharacterized protein n=1 Tax=Coemansia aciculifera TaxID=417176 RepID=A0ACC1M833_9FUNG|nr:hypothetical protein IWW38_000804 [Coemansia aciculifera]